jgi:hypothetical protein
MTSSTAICRTEKPHEAAAHTLLLLRSLVAHTTEYAFLPTSSA